MKTQATTTTVNNLTTSLLGLSTVHIHLYTGTVPTADEFWQAEQGIYGNFSLNIATQAWHDNLVAKVDININTEALNYEQKIIVSSTVEYDFTHLVDGKPTWFIVTYGNYSYFMSDKIGSFGETDAIIVLDDTSLETTDDTNKIKSFRLQLKSIIEEL